MRSSAPARPAASQAAYGGMYADVATARMVGPAVSLNLIEVKIRRGGPEGPLSDDSQDVPGTDVAEVVTPSTPSVQTARAFR